MLGREDIKEIGYYQWRVPKELLQGREDTILGLAALLLDAELKSLHRGQYRLTTCWTTSPLQLCVIDR